MGRFTGLLGIAVVLTLAWLLSTNRRAIKLRTIAWGLGLQLLFAFFVLKFEFGRNMFSIAGDAVKKLLDYSFYGSEFVFGPLGVKASNIGFIFAFQVLPTIIFIAAF